jgi:hypothetical protein
LLRPEYLVEELHRPESWNARGMEILEHDESEMGVLRRKKQARQEAVLEH